eukprot:PhF_6_TR19613/c0_g1_i3/m.28620
MDALPEPLVQQLSAFKSLQSLEDVTKLCQHVITVLSTTDTAAATQDSSIVTALTEKYSASSSEDPFLIRNCIGGLSLLYTDCARSSSSSSSGLLIDSFAQVTIIPEPYRKEIIALYKTSEQSLKTNLNRTTRCQYPRVTSASCELFHVLGNREVDPIEASNAQFQVRFAVSTEENSNTSMNSNDDVVMAVGVHQMQDMIHIFKEMIKQAEVSSQLM